MENFNSFDISPFTYIEEPRELIGILSNRLPRSANVLCMVLSSSKFQLPEEMAFFTLDIDSQTENSWITAAYFREDQGVRYNISAPGNAVITDYIISAFSKSRLINWEKKCNFSAIDRNISRFLWDIIVCEKNNVATITPTFFYTMDIDSAKNINLENDMEKSSQYRIERLDPEEGSKFIAKTWKYSQEKSQIAIKKFLGRNESAGVYINEKIICAVNVNGSGLIGMLYTVPEYRKRGLATSVMKFLLKKLATDGLVPCCAVDMNNIQSKIFHEKLGMKLSHVVDFIRNTP